MTPAEITKLSEHAKRAKALMQKSSVAGDRAASIMDNYEKTLAKFEEHLATVERNDADLSAALSAMGNGGPILEDAFREAPAGVAPSEHAHLSEVK